MYATVARVKELDYYTRLGWEFKSDLAWWHTFLVSWKDLSLLRSVSCSTPADFVIQTDASGTVHGVVVPFSTSLSSSGSGL